MATVAIATVATKMVLSLYSWKDNALKNLYCLGKEEGQ